MGGIEQVFQVVGEILEAGRAKFGVEGFSSRCSVRAPGFEEGNLPGDVFRRIIYFAHHAYDGEKFLENPCRERVIGTRATHPNTLNSYRWGDPELARKYDLAVRNRDYNYSDRRS